METDVLSGHTFCPISRLSNLTFINELLSISIKVIGGGSFFIRLKSQAKCMRFLKQLNDPLIKINKGR